MLKQQQQKNKKLNLVYAKEMCIGGPTSFFTKTSIGYYMKA